MSSDVANAIREVLVDAATRRVTLTYDGLLARLDDDDRAIAQTDLAPMLRAISLAEDNAGRGLLTGVVTRDDGLPGAGWFRLAAERGRDVADRQRAWNEELAAVYAAWSPQA